MWNLVQSAYLNLCYDKVRNEYQITRTFQIINLSSKTNIVASVLALLWTENLGLGGLPGNTPHKIMIKFMLAASLSTYNTATWSVTINKTLLVCIILSSALINNNRICIPKVSMCHYCSVAGLSELRAFPGINGQLGLNRAWLNSVPSILKSSDVKTQEMSCVSFIAVQVLPKSSHPLSLPLCSNSTPVESSRKRFIKS